MPFTFSHPAIILPLSKISSKYISFTGLIVGSMSPDFEYFIRMRMHRSHSHDLDAMIWFNLPICFALALIYHLVVKVSFVNHLPHWLSSRLKIYNSIDWLSWFKSHWYVFIYSALIGIFSHILWDSFTHQSGIFGDRFTFLTYTFNIFGKEVVLFSLLQQLSSYFGAIYIFIFLKRLPSKSIIRIPLLQKFLYWMTVFIVFSFILLIRDLTDISVFIATGISAVLIGIIISSLLSPYYEKVFIGKNSEF